jgi:hypothetical protein
VAPAASGDAPTSTTSRTALSGEADRAGKHRALTAKGITGDYTVADVALLDRFFRDYFREHGQGRTHTLQRNSLPLRPNATGRLR